MELVIFPCSYSAERVAAGRGESGPAREFGSTFYWTAKLAPDKPFQNAIPRFGYTEREGSIDGLARRLVNAAHSFKTLAEVSRDRFRVRVIDGRDRPDFEKFLINLGQDSENGPVALTEEEFKSLVGILKEHI